jgi:hypothetical protein
MEGTATIELKIKDQDIKLTMDEAIELRCLLNRLTGRPEPYHPVTPVPLPLPRDDFTNPYTPIWGPNTCGSITFKDFDQYTWTVQ